MDLAPEAVIPADRIFHILADVWSIYVREDEPVADEMERLQCGEYDLSRGTVLMLNSKLVGMFAAVLAVPFLAGCSTGQSIVRGQNGDFAGQPAVTQASHSVGAGQAAGNVTPINFTHSAPCDCEYGGANGSVVHGGVAHGGVYYGGACPDGGSHNGQGGLGCPPHKHWYRYEEPQNLVYPPANQPAPIVQYPYYTMRGPTDFFMK